MKKIIEWYNRSYVAVTCIICIQVVRIEITLIFLIMTSLSNNRFYNFIDSVDFFFRMINKWLLHITLINLCIRVNNLYWETTNLYDPTWRACIDLLGLFGLRSHHVINIHQRTKQKKCPYIHERSIDLKHLSSVKQILRLNIRKW